MIVEEKKFENKDASVIYYEGLYDSSNILGTTYFPLKNTLYISFNRGGVYSYTNIDAELYQNFKDAESQGKFFAKTIKSQPEKYHYHKEFTLYPHELEDMREVVEKSKEDKIELNSIDFGGDLPDATVLLAGEETNIIFNIHDEEYVRIDEEGFYWKGELLAEDKGIYDAFMEWFTTAQENSKVHETLTEGDAGMLQMMTTVLEFYANRDSFAQRKIEGNDIELPSFIELDQGEQARQAILLANKVLGEHNKMLDEYKEIMEDQIKNSSNPEKMESLIENVKNTMKDGPQV